MAINLALKYASKIAEVFTRESFVKEHTNGKLDFTGAKTVRVYKINTVEETDYKRTGTSRYGDAKDVQDTIFEYTMTQDKAFTGVVDKGDESDQTISDKAGKFLRQQLRERTVPGADKYALSRFARFGKVVGVAVPTKTTIVSLFADAMQSFDDDLVPDDGRIAYVPGSVFKLIATSDEFIKLEKLGEKSVAKGEVGELFGFKIVKTPSSYLPEGCYFLCLHTSAVCMPYKIAETKVHRDPVGVSGAVVEGRQYYDAFVFAEKAQAVYAAVDTAKVQAVPVITVTGGKVTMGSTGAAEIRYTRDGSDPRFAQAYNDDTGAGYLVYAAPAEVTAGDKLRAVAFAPKGKFTSAIAAFTVE